MGSRAFIIRRLLLVIPTLIGISLLIFSVISLFTPAQRAFLYVSNPEKGVDLPTIIKQYGLDQPVYVQYWIWLQEVLRGNLGWTKVGNGQVMAVLLHRLPATAEIVLYTAPIVVLLGIFLGIQSAVHRDTIIDHATRTVAIIGWSLPTFWLGLVLIAIFFSSLGWFPSGDRLTLTFIEVVRKPSFMKYTGLNSIDALLNGRFDIFVDAIRHLVLPVATLVTIQIALIVRVMRSSMLEALGKGYIITAKAKGLSKKEVINKHARRNALIPAITLAGILTASMLSGVVITETIFHINGIGRFAATAAREVDAPAVLGFALFSCLIFIFTNLIVDIVYAYIDPRIRLE